MKWSLTVGEIRDWLGKPRVEGTYDGEVTALADLRKAVPGEMSFLTGGRYARYLGNSQASVIIVPVGQEGKPAQDQVWIYAEDPSLSLAVICGKLEKRLLPQPKAGVHPSAVIDPAASVDSTACIGPNCIIEAGAMIGKEAFLESGVHVGQSARVGARSWLHHGVYIGWGCEVGNDCRLFPGAVLGADGFGFHSGKSGHQRLAQIGKVVVEDQVEIGANACVDRARFSETRIGEGTKIDNLVQVGHNVIVGKHCILCSGVGIAGSTELGNFVVLAGQVGVGGHLKIGDGVTATGQTGITKDVAPGTVLGGTPGRPHREEMKRQALLGRLPEITRRLKALEEKDG